MPDSKVHVQARKTVFAFQYKPTLKFYPKLFETAATVPGYEHWETNGLLVSLFDYNSKCNATISDKQIDFEMDHKNDFQLESDRISYLITSLPSLLGLSTFTRIGLRRKYLLPVAMQVPQLVHILQEKLFSKHETLAQLLPTGFDDLMYRIDFQKNGLKFHLTLGPVVKQEVPKYVRFNERKHLSQESIVEKLAEILKSYPDLSLFMDVDAYYASAEEMPISKLVDYKNLASAQIEELVNGLKMYIFAAEIR